MANDSIIYNANEQPEAFITADEFAPTPETEDILAALEDITAEGELVRDIENKFYSAERGKDSEENRWLEAYHNFRGVYGKTVKFRESEKSRVFVKATKTKVLAGYGQLVEVAFGGGSFPLSVEETKVPEGIAESAIFNPLGTGSNPSIEGSLQAPQETPQVQEDPFDIGFDGDGKTLAPGATMGSESKFLGGLENEYTTEGGDQLLEKGISRHPEQIQISPAKIAARRMEKLIHDQINESNGSVELRNAMFEAALLGHGVLKGPFNYKKTLHKWETNEDGSRTYAPETVLVPRLEFVSVWDFYPDPNARSMEDAEWIIQRHRYNRSQLRNLKNFPYFNRDALSECLANGPNYVNKDFENEIEENIVENIASDRYEVLEYWGTVGREIAEQMNIDISDSVDDLDEIQVNVWTCHGKVLRVVANPFTPTSLPYIAFPYERNPYSFFGVGIAENMADSQQIMNGHARMAIDNLALSGNLVFDIDESALAPGQNMNIYPGKIFRRQSGMPGQAVYAQKFPSTANENMQMFDKFRQLADEATGMPSYSHGQTGVTGTTRTAAGMSMLMGAASLNIKTVIKNLDDFLLKPLGEAYYRWNMAFYEGDLGIRGDLEIKATGTSSLIQKEVRSQRLTMFLQTAQNPAIAPFVKLPVIVRELAHSLDLDPDEIINDPDQARLYAEIIGLQNKGQGQAPAQPGLGEGGGVPAPAMPGEEEFSGGPPAQPQGGGAI